MGQEIKLANWALGVKIMVAVELVITSSGSGVSDYATWEFSAHVSGQLMVGVSGWFLTHHLGEYHSFCQAGRELKAVPLHWS